MLKLNTKTNKDLANTLAIKEEVPENIFIIEIYPSNKTSLIKKPADNLLSICFDTELIGAKTLSFNDALRIFNFITLKILPLAKINDITLIITCEDGLVASGAIAQWLIEYVEDETLDYKEIIDKNLFIQPDNNALNKMYLVQLMQQTIKTLNGETNE